ncbi:MAG: hypothetical protein K5864_01815 [Bacteroidales bacterium]|nr:hypothetical protein [Bacteroidales bacterium]
MDNKKIDGKKAFYHLERQVAEGEWGKLYRAFACQRRKGSLYWRRFAVLEQLADEATSLPEALAAQQVVETVRDGKYVYTILAQRKEPQAPVEPEPARPSNEEVEEPVVDECVTLQEEPVESDDVNHEDAVTVSDTAIPSPEEAAAETTESRVGETVDKIKDEWHGIVTNRRKWHALVIAVLFVVIAVLVVIRLNMRPQFQPLVDDLVPEDAPIENVE